jgi:hypothetical protein
MTNVICDNYRHDEIVMIEGFINLTLFSSFEFENRVQHFLGLGDKKSKKIDEFMKPSIMTNQA